MENNSNNNSFLDDFSWDDITPTLAAKAPTPPKEEEPDEEGHDEKQDAHVNTPLSSEEEIPAEEIQEDDEEIASEQEPNEELKEAAYNFKSVLENLGFNDLSDEEITEADFLTMMEESFDEIVEAQVKEEIESLRPTLGDKGADLLRFLKAKQGTFDDYMRHWAVKELLVDIETDSGQESFARWYLAENDDLDADEIDEKIEELKEKEKLDSWSKSRYVKLKKKQDADREAAMKKKLDEEAQREATARQHREEMRNKIRSLKEVAGLKLNDVEKVKHSNYALKPTVKSGEKYITPLMAKVMEIYKNPEQLLLLSKIVESDFDFSAFKEEGSKAALKQVKTNVERRKEAAPVKTKNSPKQASLEDLFED